MATFKIKFKTDNDAFKDGGAEFEVARILRTIAEHVLAGEDAGKVFDVNGNSIGTWSLRIPA